MQYFAPFFIGLFAGFIGSVTTGANLISIPALIFLGNSPLVAIATTRLSAGFGGLATAYSYNQEGKVRWRSVPALVPLVIIAGVLGPLIVSGIDERWLQPIIAVLLLAMLPLMFVKHRFGEKRRKTSRKMRVLGAIAVFAVMVYGTGFGVGGAVFLLYSFMYFYGMTLLEASATAAVIWMIGAGTALIAFIPEGKVNFAFGVPLTLGAMIGGYLGPKLAVREGVSWVKHALAALILISAVRLLFFSGAGR